VRAKGIGFDFSVRQACVCKFVCFVVVDVVVVVDDDVVVVVFSF